MALLPAKEKDWLDLRHCDSQSAIVCSLRFSERVLDLRLDLCRSPSSCLDHTLHLSIIARYTVESSTRAARFERSTARVVVRLERAIAYEARLVLLKIGIKSVDQLVLARICVSALRKYCAYLPSAVVLLTA